MKYTHQRTKKIGGWPEDKGWMKDRRRKMEDGGGRMEGGAEA
jgi:hypothetical protein